MMPSPVNVTAAVVNGLNGPAAAAGGATSNSPGAFERELQRASEPPADTGEQDAARAPSTAPEARPGRPQEPTKANPRSATPRETQAAPIASPATPLAHDGEAVADEDSGLPALSDFMAQLIGLPAEPAAAPAAGALPGLPLAVSALADTGTANPGRPPLPDNDAVAAAAAAPELAPPTADSLRALAVTPGTRNRADADNPLSAAVGVTATARAAQEAPAALRVLSDTEDTANTRANAVDAALSTSTTPATATALPMAATQAGMPGLAAAPAVAEASIAPLVQSAAFGPALGTQIAHFARDGVEHARLQLHPADMGPVAVQLALEGQQVRVDLVAEMAATRQTLEQALPALAGALRDAGFTLSGGGVFQQARDGSAQGNARNTDGALAPDTRAGDALADTAPTPARAARTQGLVDLFA